METTDGFGEINVGRQLHARGDLQRDALLAAGVDARHLYEDRASGAKDDWSGLAQ